MSFVLADNLELLKDITLMLIKINNNNDLITSNNFKMSNSKFQDTGSGLYLKTLNSTNIVTLIRERTEQEIANEPLIDNDPNSVELIVRNDSFFICSTEIGLLKKMFCDFYQNKLSLDIPNMDSFDEEVFQASLIVPDMICIDALNMYKLMLKKVPKDYYISYDVRDYSTELLKNVHKDLKKFIKDYIRD